VGTSVVDLPLLVRGFKKAYIRFDQAAKESDSEAAFHALFEALAWTYVVDQGLKRPAQSELRGLRFVRNRVHHRWADALFLDTGGVSFPITFPVVFFEWRWRPVKDLPRGQKEGLHEYESHLVNHPARVTLGTVLDYLRDQGYLG